MREIDYSSILKHRPSSIVDVVDCLAWKVNVETSQTRASEKK